MAPRKRTMRTMPRATLYPPWYKWPWFPMKENVGAKDYGPIYKHWGLVCLDERDTSLPYWILLWCLFDHYLKALSRISIWKGTRHRRGGPYTGRTSPCKLSLRGCCAVPTDAAPFCKKHFDCDICSRVSEQPSWAMPSVSKILHDGNEMRLLQTMRKMKTQYPSNTLHNS